MDQVEDVSGSRNGRQLNRKSLVFPSPGNRTYTWKKKKEEEEKKGAKKEEEAEKEKVVKYFFSLELKKYKK